MNPYNSFNDFLRFHKEMDLMNWQFGGEKMRIMFLARPEYLPHSVIHREGDISPLDYDLREDIGSFRVKSRLGSTSFQDYIKTGPVNGVLILHRNRVVFEQYPRMRDFDKHLFMSVTKIYVSTLIAILEDEGLIDSDLTVDHYLEGTRGSGWEGVKVRDVLDMTSGIASIETDTEAYTNPDHPHYQYEASLGWLEPTKNTRASTYEHVASLKSKQPPGEAFEYSSVNTFLLSWLAEKITVKPFNEIVSEKIWSKIGAEADGLISVSKMGAPSTHGGLCATLRDMVRFGRHFTPSVRQSSTERLISDSYLKKIQHGGRSVLFDKGVIGQMIIENLHGEKPLHNSYQWDFVMPDGDFFKAGFGGQGLYISPARDLVIGYFGTSFDEKLEENELVWIARQFVNSNLFS